MPGNVAKGYQSSSGHNFLIMGPEKEIEIYGGTGSPWKPLNGHSYPIESLEKSLNAILADPLTRGGILSQHPNEYVPYVGKPDDVVMIRIGGEWDAFYACAGKYLK